MVTDEPAGGADHWCEGRQPWPLRDVPDGRGRRVADAQKPDNGARLAYNLAHFMRTLAMPKTAEPWSLTSLRERPIKIGAKVTSHGPVRRNPFADRRGLRTPAPA